jgi:hypothetical protein
MLKYLSQAGIGALMIMGICCADLAQAKDLTPEPDGIQTGGFVLHPGASAAIAFDARGSQGHNDGYVDLGVQLNTRLANEETKSWDNKVAFNWKQYWGIGDAKANGGPDITVSTNADLFKQSMFRVAPNASYSYLSDPEDDDLRQDFVNHHLAAGVAAYIQPSAGAVFSQRIAYHFDGKFYPDHSDVSNMQHRIDAVTRWNFLPQTSMALNIDFRITHYLESVRGTSDQFQYGGNTNSTSMPIRLTYSLQGLMLARLSYQLGLGYAYQNYTNGLKEHMFTMNAKLKYEFEGKKSLSLEYKKDFNNVIYGDYYKSHRVDLTFNALWFDHLQTEIAAGFGAFDFKSLETMPRTDYLVNAQANIDYHFFPGMKLGLHYRLRLNVSDYYGASYIKNMISLNFAYEY